MWKYLLICTLFVFAQSQMNEQITARNIDTTIYRQQPEHIESARNLTELPIKNKFVRNLIVNSTVCEPDQNLMCRKVKKLSKYLKSILTASIAKLKKRDDTILELRQEVHYGNDRANQREEEIQALSNQLVANKRKFEAIIAELNTQIFQLKAQTTKSNSSPNVPNGQQFTRPEQPQDILSPLPTHCPFNEACWIIVEQRFDGSVDFYRNWNDYRKGFGDVNTEFFIGLENLHNLTNSQQHELYIVLHDFENQSRYAIYDNFVVGNEREHYELKSIGNYMGNLGNALQFNINQKFSTYDRDNDFDEDNCAKDLHGAWWYHSCGAINLNGRYLNAGATDCDVDEGIIWGITDDWHDWEYSYKSVTMMIRPKVSYASSVKYLH